LLYSYTYITNLKFRLNIFFMRLVRTKALACLVLLFSCIEGHAQSNLKEIASAIKQGDAKELSLFFDKQIDLTFSENTNTYSKNQAEQILQKFFIKVGPTNFVNEQQGTSTANNTRFVIGNMNSESGVYKVYMFFVQKSGQYMLRELRFEK